MDNSISSTKRQQLRHKIKTSKKAIQALLKQYKYEEDVPHQKNMKKLCTCLQNVMGVQSLQDFEKFISHKQHLPIQTNFMALKYQKLIQIFEDWLASKQENINVLDRSLTHKHRNILFKRIFIQQKDTIRQFFQTLSQKKKLKGFDLFQLLTELLGPYFLYQFNSDTESFFEKTNSFQSFAKIVQSYVKSGIRIYNKDRNDANDQLYIRLHELQALIQFWQLLNPQLTIQQFPRKNLNEASIQTTQVNLVNVQIQTQKQISKGFITILNRTLHQINTLIESQNEPELLQSFDKIIDVIRTQKIFAVNYYAQKNQRKFQRNNKYMISSDYSEAEPILNRESPRMRVNSPYKNRASPKVLTNNNNNLLTSLNEKQQDDTKVLFKYLCSLDNLYCLTTNILQTFFCEIGLTQNRQTFLINNLINYGFIEEKNDITLKQFKNILRQLMSQNKKFNLQAIKNYISTNVEGGSLRKTAYFKNSDTNHNKSQILSQSILGGNNRSYRQESRTTYPMDSDGSNI